MLPTKLRSKSPNDGYDYTRKLFGRAATRVLGFTSLWGNQLLVTEHFMRGCGVFVSRGGGGGGGEPLRSGMPFPALQ